MSLKYKSKGNNTKHGALYFSPEGYDPFPLPKSAEEKVHVSSCVSVAKKPKWI